jgi:hypothetical protein
VTGSQHPAQLFLDNQGVLKSIVSGKVSAQMRHNAIKLSFIRDLHDLGVFEGHWVDTTNQIGNVFTKPLANSSFDHFVKLIRDGGVPLVVQLKEGAKTSVCFIDWQLHHQGERIKVKKTVRFTLPPA